MASMLGSLQGDNPCPAPGNTSSPPARLGSVDSSNARGKNVLRIREKGTLFFTVKTLAFKIISSEIMYEPHRGLVFDHHRLHRI